MLIVLSKGCCTARGWRFTRNNRYHRLKWVKSGKAIVSPLQGWVSLVPGTQRLRAGLTCVATLALKPKKYPTVEFMRTRGSAMLRPYVFLGGYFMAKSFL